VPEKTAPNFADVRALQRGDQVRMPCAPEVWQTVYAVRDLGHNIFAIDFGTRGEVGCGGEMPLEIRKAHG